MISINNHLFIPNLFQLSNSSLATNNSSKLIKILGSLIGIVFHTTVSTTMRRYPAKHIGTGNEAFTTSTTIPGD